ncbi:NUDIX hydrolase [Candidatus Saccharibacteria bacterium]|nr:NUDIX hydrolase [Candidatus Saccharibacteria bacterium]
MSYKDSFIYSLRQKVGDMRLITATVGVFPINAEGKIKMVYAKQFGYWTGIGGHVELGDSWQSAALNELYEEGGIIADADDLEIFATLSGPGRIYHYTDGTTQPFTLCFLCRRWKEELLPTDVEEVDKTEWCDFEEARKRTTDKRMLLALDACEEYLKTGKVQMIIEE